MKCSERFSGSVYTVITISSIFIILYIKTISNTWFLYNNCCGLLKDSIFKFFGFIFVIEKTERKKSLQDGEVLAIGDFQKIIHLFCKMQHKATTGIMLKVLFVHL